MTIELIILSIIIIIATLLFATGAIRMDLTALFVLTALALTGLVSPTQAVSGFSNHAVIIVWAMYILSAGLTRTGISMMIGEQLLKFAGKSEGRMVAVLMSVTALLSSVMNNIGITAMFLPITLEIAKRTKRPPSKLLLPMAYGALHGGLILLIGTASNLVIRDAMLEAQITPFNLFDFAPGGLAILFVSVTYMVLIGRHFLPTRETPRALSADDVTNGEFDQEQYGLEERLALLILPDDSSLAGKTLVDSRIGRSMGLNVLNVKHKGGQVVSAEPNLVLESGDRLLVLGRLDRINEISKSPMFFVDEDQAPLETLLTGDVELAELEVMPDSPFAGKNLVEIDLRQQYELNALAIRQGDAIRRTHLRKLTLNPGNVVLLHGATSKINTLSEMVGLRRLSMKDSAAYHLDERLLSVRIPENSALVGRQLVESQLGAAFGLAVLRICRNGCEFLMPKPDFTLRAGDLLVIEGRPLDIDVLRGLQSLEIERKTNIDLQNLGSGPIQIVEVMLSPYSNLAGKNLRDTRFRDKYGVSVLAIWRGDRVYRSMLGEITLQHGDTLLCYGAEEKLRALARERDFLVLKMALHEKPLLKKAPLAVLIMAAVMLTAVFFDVPITISAIAGCSVMVLTGILSMDDAYQSINWRSIFLIAAMLPLGIAIQETGAASLVANFVINLIGGFGNTAILAGLMVLGIVSTLVVPSPVVAVMMAPIALNAALSLGISPYAFLMGIAYGVEASFLSSATIPANTLVMGPGGYRYSDYIKHGLPLTLIVLVVSLILLPLIFPYYH